MTWVKLDDHFADHPKILGLSDSAYRAYVDGLCYCTRYLTDGKIAEAPLKKLARGKIVGELVTAGLWEQNGNGIVVHDYLDYQFSRSEIEAARLQRVEAGRAGGKRSGEARSKRLAALPVEAGAKQK